MTDRKDEFLYRWPSQLSQKSDSSSKGNWRKNLIDLSELEKRMDKIIGEQIVHDNDMMNKIMVEVYDAYILRRSSSPESATLGKMSVASAVQKFQ